MRLLQVANTLQATDGGPARNSFELNQSLNSIPGVQSHLRWVHGKAEGTTAGVDEAAGRKLLDPRPRRLTMVGTDNILADIIKSDAIIIHGYYLPWALVLARLARRHGKPLFIMPHGSISSFEAAKSALSKRIFDKVMSAAIGNSVTFVTGSLSESADVRAAKPRARVDTAGVGVRQVVRSEHVPVDNPQRSLTLLSISRIAEKKRIDLMIDAVIELTARGIRSSLLVAGTGPASLCTALKRRTVAHGVEDRVTFLGQVSPAQKAALFAHADVFLLPSDDENFGIGLAEALANGVPAITSDRVAAASLVTSQSTTILTSPTGPSIADAILDFRDPDSWAAAHRAAVRDAQRAFDWEAVAQRWAAIIRAELTRTR